MGEVQQSLKTGDLAKTSLRALRQNLGAFLRIITVPTLLLTALQIATPEVISWLQESLDPFWFVISFNSFNTLISAFLFTLIFTACVRFVIYDRFPSSPLAVDFGKTEFRFFIVALLVTAVIFVPFLLVFFAAYAVQPPMDAQISENVNASLNFMGWHVRVAGDYAPAIMLAAFITMIGALWTMLRLIPFFVELAIHPSGQLMEQFKKAWGMSKGTTLKLLGALAGIIIFFILLGIVLIATIFLINAAVPMVGGVNIDFVFTALITNAFNFLALVVISTAVALYYQRIV